MRRFVWLVAVTAAASVLAALAIGVAAAGGVTAARSDPSIQYLLIVPVPFLAAGIWLLARHPDLRTGWLLVGATAGTMGYAALLEQVVKSRTSVVPETWVSIALGAEAVVTGAGLACLVLLLALFPGGTARVARERRLVRAVWSFPALMAVSVLANEHVPVDTVTYGRMDPFPNPLHLGWLAWLGPPTRSLRYVLGLSLLAAFAFLVLRYREATSTERRQIRWVLFGSAGALAIGVVPFLLEPILDPESVTHDSLLFLSTVVMLLIPLSTVVAIEQPRWIDTDEVIRKSFAYGVLTIGIFVVYAAVAAGLGMAAGARLPVEAAIAVTAGLAFLFQPTRARLQFVADRWVFGDRPTPGEALAGFEAAVRQGGQASDVGDRLAELVQAAARLHWAVVSLPPGPDHVSGRPVGDPAVTLPIRHHDEVYGEVRCGPRMGGPLSDRDREVVTALAAQAGLVIANLRLAARIVHAQEAERRRIERNIHDGAQQELVALVAKLGLARGEVRRGTLGEQTLVELQDDARTILHDLRELAQGIHPSVLTDGGLVEAVEDRAARLPIPVSIEAAPELRARRFDDDVEGAAYFFVTEGLANVLKHAGARHARVSIRRVDGHLELSVGDDGRGFDPAVVRRNGLAGLSDRIEALAGTVTVDTAPGAGTLVRAQLPVDRRDG